MARIFTTSFEFNHKVYDAIISIIINNGQLNYSIKVLDSELQEFLPEKISYTGSRGFENLASLNNTIAQSLMRCLSVSIDRHLIATK